MMMKKTKNSNNNSNYNNHPESQQANLKGKTGKDCLPDPPVGIRKDKEGNEKPALEFIE